MSQNSTDSETHKLTHELIPILAETASFFSARLNKFGKMLASNRGLLDSVWADFSAIRTYTVSDNFNRAYLHNKSTKLALRVRYSLTIATKLTLNRKSLS